MHKQAITWLLVQNNLGAVCRQKRKEICEESIPVID